MMMSEERGGCGGGDLVSCLQHLEKRLQRLDRLLDSEKFDEESLEADNVAIETDLEVCGKIVRSLFRHLASLSREDARRIRHAELTWCRISLAAIERSLKSTEMSSSPADKTDKSGETVTVDQDETLVADATLSSASTSSSSSSSSSMEREDEYDWDDESRAGYLSERHYEETVDEASALRFLTDFGGEDYRNFIDSVSDEVDTDAVAIVNKDSTGVGGGRRRRRRHRRHRRRMSSGPEESEAESELLVSRESLERQWLLMEERLMTLLNNDKGRDDEVISELGQLESMCSHQRAISKLDMEERLRWTQAWKSIRFIGRAIDVTTALRETALGLTVSLKEVKESSEETSDSAMMRLSALKARLLDLNLAVHTIVNRVQSHLDGVFHRTSSEENVLDRFSKLKADLLKLYAEWDAVFVAVSMRNSQDVSVVRRRPKSISNNDDGHDDNKDSRRDSAFVEFEGISESSSSGFCTDNDPMNASGHGFEHIFKHNDIKTTTNHVTLVDSSDLRPQSKTPPSLLLVSKVHSSVVQKENVESSLTDTSAMEKSDEMTQKTKLWRGVEWPRALRRAFKMALPIQCVLSATLVATYAFFQPRCCDLSVFGSSQPLVQLHYPYGPPPI